MLVSLLVSRNRGLEKPSAHKGGLELRVNLDPKEPTFFGLLNIVSVYGSLMKVGYFGLRWGLKGTSLNTDS